MSIDLNLVGLALSAGVVAFFNPCGFALLPSYIAHYLGSRPSVSGERWWERLVHGVTLGMVVSAGFFTVFLILGGALALVGTTLGAYFPWAALTIGLALIVLGVFTLLGYELKLSLPSWGHSPSEGVFFYYLYGIGYAIASCGCTLPIFMIYVVGPTLTAGPLSGVLNFFAYATGMTLMMLVLSLSIAYSKGSLDRRLPLRQALVGASIPVLVVLALLWAQPQVAASWGATLSGTNRVFISVFALALLVMLFFQIRRWERATRLLNALLLAAAGLYLIYYQLFEYGLLDLLSR